MSETPNEGAGGVSACDFCHGKPVQNAASWADGKPRPPAACPRCGRVSVEGQDARLAFWIDVLRREVGLDHRDNDEPVEVKGRTLHSLSQAVDAALVESEDREREWREKAAEDNAAIVADTKEILALRAHEAVLVEALRAIANGRWNKTGEWKTPSLTASEFARKALAGVVEAEPDGSERLHGQ